MRQPLETPDRTSLRMPLLIFLTFVPLYLATTRGHFVSTDEVTVYQAAQSLWERGSVSVRIDDTRETMKGRSGAYYGVYNSGEAIAVVPLYAIGRLVDRSLGSDSSMRRALAGHVLSQPGVAWGGEIPIFFVNLFNVFLTAALMAVFFMLALKMTGSARWSLLSTLLLGCTAYIASLSGSFLQHTSEALFGLSAFVLFFLDRRTPDWRLRAGAGALFALMIQFRFPAVVAFPGLLTYHAASIWLRQPLSSIAGRLRRAVVEIAPSLVGVTCGFGLHLLDQYLKFGTTRSIGYLPFDTPLAIGMYGYLFSPGMSIVLYTPMLVLLPFAFRTFQKRFRLEAAFLLLHAATYLVVFSQYREWHGLWYFGPRYLSTLIPYLFLPIAVWMSVKGRRTLVPVFSLGAIGLWMQAVHVAVNYWWVAQDEGYLKSGPHREFLFDPWNAPFVAHSRALLAGDHRVDMWLVDVARFAGGPVATILAMVLAAIVILGLTALASEVERGEGGARWRSFRYAAAGVPALVLGSALLLGAAAPAPPRAAVTDEQLMNQGIDALYRRRAPVAAEAFFRTVLTHNPEHYGANYQLAVTLDRSGRMREALPLWEKVLEIAQTCNDQRTIGVAQKRLKR